MNEYDESRDEYKGHATRESHESEAARHGLVDGREGGGREEGREGGWAGCTKGGREVDVESQEECCLRRGAASRPPG